MNRTVDSLTIEDIERFPIWRFSGSDAPADSIVTPIRRLPVRSLSGCVVGTPISLANGTKLMAILGNVDLANEQSTEQFLTLSVLHRDGRVFHLARYFDIDFADRGPAKLAAFLGYPVSAVFPIAYDISKVAVGVPECVQRQINPEPRQRLSREQIIALAVP